MPGAPVVGQLEPVKGYRRLTAPPDTNHHDADTSADADADESSDRSFCRDPKCICRVRVRMCVLTKSPRQGCPHEGRWTSGQVDLAPHFQLLSIGNWEMKQILKSTSHCRALKSIFCFIQVAIRYHPLETGTL